MKSGKFLLSTTHVVLLLVPTCFLLFAFSCTPAKYGFIDKTGRMVIEPRFDHAREFSEGLAAVYVDGKWGYIDKTGKMLIEPQFERAYSFSNGRARVAFGIGPGIHALIGAKFGFIDKSGKIVIQPKYDWAYDFSDGLACVVVVEKRAQEASAKTGEGSEKKCTKSIPVYPKSLPRNGKSGYIDTDGRIVVEPQFDYACPFSEGLAAVRIGPPHPEGKWGYIDKTGKIVIKPRFSRAWDFSEGLAGTWDGEKFVYIDRTGKAVIERELGGWSFSEELAAVYIDDGVCCDGKSIFIDNTGKTVIERPVYSPYSFSEGLASVQLEKSEKNGKVNFGKRGFIDKNGRVVIKPQFESASSFSEGLARVYVDGKYGYIDKTGKIVIEPKFNDAGHFSEGFTFATTGKKCFSHVRY